MNDEDEPEPELVVNPVECPMCGCENHPMGGLGNLVHFRCRDCGAGYSQELKHDCGTPATATESAAAIRNADRVDGYDRDDIGESPDW